MAYLIHGFFFQNRNWLDIAYRSEVEGGAGVIIQSGLCRLMYTGVIFTDPENESELIGEMSDCFGESKLLNVKITDTEIFFIKKYDHREGFIEYYFKHEGGIWIGWYHGKTVGKGDAKCILTTAPDSLFLPPE